LRPGCWDAYAMLIFLSSHSIRTYFCLCGIIADAVHHGDTKEGVRRELLVTWHDNLGCCRRRCGLSKCAIEENKYSLCIWCCLSCVYWVVMLGLSAMCDPKVNVWKHSRNHSCDGVRETKLTPFVVAAPSLPLLKDILRGVDSLAT
jgi:hypothetical protein